LSLLPATYIIHIPALHYTFCGLCALVTKQSSYSQDSQSSLAAHYKCRRDYVLYFGTLQFVSDFCYIHRP